MKIQDGPIILGTVVMEKLGAVNFEHAFLSDCGYIEVMVNREVERKIKQETGFWPQYAVIDVDDPEKGTWEMVGALDAPKGMALEYPTRFSFRIPDSEITLALNILCYGLDEHHVREALKKWAVKRLSLGYDGFEQENVAGEAL